MKLIRALLDYKVPWKLPDVCLFTGNPVLKRNGAIVMGRGAAREVRDRYPGIDMSFGSGVIQYPEAHILWVKITPKQVIGWFKVKYHWADIADITLIQHSTQELTEFAINNPNNTFHMNFPGVGNGKLHERDVIPVLNTLPDNVRLYR